MLALEVKDFGVTTEHVFVRPIPFQKIDFMTVSEAMLRTFDGVLLPKDIALNRGDQLYDYRLSLSPFKGSADIGLNSSGITTAFRNGKNKRALQLIRDSLVSIETMFNETEVQFRRITFSAHAEFQNPGDFEAYMESFANKARGCTGGGITLRSSNNPFKGQMRFSTDKSLVVESGIFVAYEVIIEESFSNEQLKSISARFDEVSKDLQLQINLPE